MCGRVWLFADVWLCVVVCTNRCDVSVGKVDDKLRVLDEVELCAPDHDDVASTGGWCSWCGWCGGGCGEVWFVWLMW